MKHVLLFAILICSVANIKGQAVIKYSYDNAGNRVKREIVMTQQNKVTEENKGMEAYSDKLAEHIIEIYPNPTEGNLSIGISNIDLENQVSIMLYDMEGKLLRQLKVTSTLSNMDISDISNGIYIMQVVIDKEKTTWKIVKK